MTITDLRSMTRDQLLKAPLKLKEVTYNTDRSQVVLKDGIYTVSALRKLSGQTTLVWGA